MGMIQFTHHKMSRSVSPIGLTFQLLALKGKRKCVSFGGRPKIQKPKNFPPRCENIIKMIGATFWVLVFAKTQKGSFIESTKTQKPRT
jgi:hypothetical protein